jgi:hypothetical protein
LYHGPIATRPSFDQAQLIMKGGEEQISKMFFPLKEISPNTHSTEFVEDGV